MSNNSKALEIAEKYFHELNLEDWTLYDGIRKSGGQSTIITVEDKNGVKGAFRYLQKKNPVSIARFNRELQILTNPEFSHPSIVKILDHSVDTHAPWYISKLGESFTDYWEKQRTKYKDNPEKLLSIALDLILNILNGLIPLHEKGVVHRDIKPENLIIDIDENGNAIPVLIDFGLVFIQEEERITTEDQAVGNARFSPDVMMNRMNEILPWLDIFQISQLLIWLVSVRPNKYYWHRPLDWKWVNYPYGISEDHVLSLQALTAICADHYSCPKNARDMSELIKKIFSYNEVNKVMDYDSDKISQAINRGQTKQLRMKEEDIRIIRIDFQSANLFYHRLNNEVESIYSGLEKNRIPINKPYSFNSMDRFLELFIHEENFTEHTLYSLALGNTDSHKFNFTIKVFLYRPNQIIQFRRTKITSSTNIFFFQLTREVNHIDFQSLTREYIVKLQHNGVIQLETGKMDRSSETINRETSISELRTIIHDWLTDEIVWESIQKNQSI